MNIRTSAKRLCALVLGGALCALMPETAFAWGHPYGSVMDFDAWNGYTVAIQDVYQFPASIVWQRGVELPIAPPVPLFIRVDEHHVLLR
jgi:hypothetical protein